MEYLEGGGFFFVYTGFAVISSKTLVFLFVAGFSGGVFFWCGENRISKFGKKNKNLLGLVCFSCARCDLAPRVEQCNNAS